MRKIILALTLSLLSGVAFAQSNPGFTPGKIPTAAQWNAAFSAKQDVLSYTPVPLSGGVMTGALITKAPTNVSWGFVLPPGVSPISPPNGAVWTTSTGLFAQINGATVGPMTPGAVGPIGGLQIGAGLSSDTVNLNCNQATSAVFGCVYGDGTTLALTAGVLAIDLTHANAWTGIQTFPANSIAFSKLAQGGAATFVGNPTASTANVDAFTIAGLTASTSPDATNDYIPIWDHMTGTIKKVNPTTIAGANTSGVSTLNGLSGALSVTVGSAAITVTPSGSSVAVDCATATSSLIGCGKPDGSSITAAAGVWSASGGRWWWGDGSSGDHTCSGAENITADTFYNNLTISSGCAMTLSAKIFVAGTLDISAAPTESFKANGGNGTAASGATAGAGGTIASPLYIGHGGLGGAGGNGTLTVGVVGNNGGYGNNGGSTLLAGSGGYTAAFPTPAPGGIAIANAFVGSQWPNYPIDKTDGTFGFSSINLGAGGSGGGGGNGNTDAGGGGGGGGAGAGGIFIFAKTIARGTNTNAAIFQAKGGDGAAGADGGGDSGGDGGGGGGSGGGGGWVVLIFGVETGSAITNAIGVGGGAGAAGGAGHISGSLGGGGGASGGTGTVYLFNLGAGTLTQTTVTAGTLGTAATTTSGGAGAAANTKQVNL